MYIYYKRILNDVSRIQMYCNKQKGFFPDQLFGLLLYFQGIRAYFLDTKDNDSVTDVIQGIS